MAVKFSQCERIEEKEREREEEREKKKDEFRETMPGGIILGTRVTDGTSLIEPSFLHA